MPSRKSLLSACLAMLTAACERIGEVRGGLRLA